MEKVLTGICVWKEEPIRYYMIRHLAGGITDAYGILVEFKEERAVIEHISPVRKKVQDLLECMRKGMVTPVSVPDIVEDWLIGESLQREWILR